MFKKIDGKFGHTTVNFEAYLTEDLAPIAVKLSSRGLKICQDGY